MRYRTSFTLDKVSIGFIENYIKNCFQICKLFSLKTILATDLGVNYI